MLLFFKKETEYSNDIKKRKMSVKNKWFELRKVSLVPKKVDTFQSRGGLLCF